MKIEGAIFDMDGTMLDSLPMWDRVCFEYLEQKNIPPRPGLREALRPLNLTESALYYQREYGVEDSVEEYIAAIVDMIRDFYFFEVQKKPGIEEFLESLAAKNIPLCVATATDRDLTEAALSRLGLLKYFSAIFTCTEAGGGKGQPLVFNLALQHLSTPRASTMVFEDSLQAAFTAKQAGFLVGAVYDPSEEDTQEQLKAVADIYIHDWREMGERFD